MEGELADFLKCLSVNKKNVKNYNIGHKLV
jgi:hypothetical protein